MKGRMQLGSAVRGVAIVMSLGCMVAACQDEPPPPPPGGLSEATRAQLLDYAQGLAFDARRAATSVCGELSFGYEPVKGLGRISALDIRAGRIIGRISLNIPAMRLGLAAGLTYVWIDSIAGRQWRLGTLPTEPQQQVQFVEITRECHDDNEVPLLKNLSAIFPCPRPEATMAETDAWFECDEDGLQCCCCMGAGPCRPDSLLMLMPRARVTPLRDTINFIAAFTTSQPTKSSAKR